MKEGNIQIVSLNPKTEVRKIADNASEWKCNEEAAYLSQLAVIIRDRMVDPISRLDRRFDWFEIGKKAKGR